MTKALIIIIKTLASFIIGLLLLTSLFYLDTIIYDFPEKSKFSGEEIYNPYLNLPKNKFKANFHAHSVSWEGVTNGHNTEKDIFDAYQDKDYDIVGISNYHKISTYAKDKSDLYIPVYEHGYNVLKSHYLAIGSEEVSYFDYPLFQLSSHKQKIIENLHENKALICLAHPKFGGGRTFSDMQKLVNYDFIEVLNHYRISDEYWDQSLSSGRLAWILGNDDTHDIVNEDTFKIWNIIYSENRDTSSVFLNLKSGKNYAVTTRNGHLENGLVSCQVDSLNTIQIKLNAIADEIHFIGQNGQVKKVVYNTDQSSYNFQADDTYVRIVAQNSQSTIYLNPIIRYDGQLIPLVKNLKATKNIIYTWLFRFLIISLSILFLWILRLLIK